MNARWGLIIGLCGGAAVLAFVMVERHPETLSPRIRGSGDSYSDGATSDEPSADGEPVQRLRRGASGAGSASTPGAGKPKRLAESSDTESGGLLRRRLALPATGAHVGAAEGARRQINNEGSGVSGELPLADESMRARDVPPTHAAPSVGTPGAAESVHAKNEANPDAQPDPGVADVLYDSGDHVFDTVSRAEVTDAGPISGQAGTLSFWIQPEWAPNNQDASSLIQLGGDDGLQIIKDGNMLRLAMPDGSPLEGGGGASLADWQAGEWRQVALTWNGTFMALYVDGVQQVANGTWTPGDPDSELQLHVGGAAFPNRPPVALGQLSSVMVLNGAASSEEIQRMFQTGGPPRR